MVAVVTDTTQYLPRAVIERHGIHLVSLYVNWNGRTDREIDLPDYDAYYDFLISAGELPSTSQPSVGDFLAVYEPLAAPSRARSAPPSRRSRCSSSAAWTSSGWS
jgi:fatty acid-binding protein DegV